MSTSAESALNWLRDEQPNDQTVQEMIEKLNARIEQSNLPEDKLQGSIEALDVLETHLAGSSAQAPDADTGEPQLDLTPLTDHAHVPPERPAAEKRALFEQLKRELESRQPGDD